MPQQSYEDGEPAPMAIRRRRQKLLTVAIDIVFSLTGILFMAIFISKNSTGPGFFLQALTPRAGEAQGLDYGVREGVEKARARGLHEVSLGRSLTAHPYLQQRFTEGLYPIRVAVASRYVILGHDDSVPDNCRLVDVRLPPSHYASLFELYDCAQ